MKFANLYVDGKKWKNMGDDMMVNAIFNLYAYMGIDKSQIVRIPVSHLRSYDGDEVILPLNYPFYGNFTLSPKIHPVFLGISAMHKSIIENMQLRKYEPIGCRDLHTYRMLRKEGLDAYINGCMTITLPKRKVNNEANKVYLIDIPDELRRYLPAWVKYNCIETTQNFFDDDVAGCTEEFTQKQYEEYINNAKLVVTSRLHCALPCAAAGIPVILALKAKSFRYNWLENIIPLYTPDNYDTIDWNPVPLEFEKEKSILLEHAANRVLNEYNRLVNRHKIANIYMNDLEDYSFESTREAVAYMKEHWNSSTKAQYILWGVTQTAEVLYDYINENYKNVNLKAIIDLYHEQIWHGVKTCNTDIISKDDSSIIFVTVEAANEDAKRLFAEKNIKNYVICWNNPKTLKNSN